MSIPTSTGSARPPLTLALLLTLAATGEAQVRPERVKGPLRDAGVYHVATGTWSRHQHGKAALGPDVIYANTAHSGYFGAGWEGTPGVDELVLPGTGNAKGGPQDSYVIDGFEFAYCTSSGLPTASATMVFYDSYTPCDDPDQPANCLSAAATIDLSNVLPTGGSGCWTVTIDLSGGEEFCLAADGGPCAPGYQGGGQGLDHAGWSVTWSTGDGANIGPVLAGDPNWAPAGQGTCYDPSQSCAAGVTGLGFQDNMWAGGACVNFGGYSNLNGCGAKHATPPAQYHLQLLTDCSVACGPCTLKKDDAFEPNDLCSLATPLGEGLHDDLALLDVSPDWYAIQVPAWEALSVQARLDVANPVQMLLFESCGGALLDSDLAGGLEPEVSWKNDTGATQIVWLELLLPGPGTCNTYELEVESGPLFWDRGILDANLMAVPDLGQYVMNVELAVLAGDQAPDGLDLSVRVQVSIDGQPAFDDVLPVQSGGSPLGCLPNGGCPEPFPCGVVNLWTWWGGLQTWQKKCLPWYVPGQCSCVALFPIPVYLPWASIAVGANIDVEITPAPGSADDLLTANDTFSFTFACGADYSYCDPADTNSTGFPGRLSLSTCNLALGELAATGYSLPANQFGYLLVGDGTAVVQPPGASGHLCLAGGSVLGRYSKDVASTGADGELVTDLLDSQTGGPGGGLPSPPGGQLAPGSTWNFQYWHRDGMSSNFTNAVSVTFQ